MNVEEESGKRLHDVEFTWQILSIMYPKHSMISMSGIHFQKISLEDYFSCGVMFFEVSWLFFPGGVCLINLLVDFDFVACSLVVPMHTSFETVV